MGTEIVKLPALPGEGVADTAAEIVRLVEKSFKLPPFQAQGHAESWKLPPATAVREVVEAIEARSEPGGLPCGRECAVILTTAFPKLEPHDPEGYMKHLEFAFGEYPVHVAKAAAAWLVRTRKFLPTPADVHEGCRMAGEHDRRTLAYAKAIEAERSRREKDAARSQKIEAEKKAFRAKHGDKTPMEVFFGDRSPAKKMGAG